MRKRLLALAMTVAAALAFPIAQASAAPDPIPFCMPDLDGHCRYCELRFAPISIRCVGG